MATKEVRVGSQIRTLKSLKAWAPFAFGQIPAGAQGKVIRRYINVYPTITGSFKIAFAVVDFRWVDKKGQAKSARWPVPEEDLNKNFKVIQPKPSSVMTERPPRLTRKAPRITSKTPRLR